MTDTALQANRLRKNALGAGAITFMVVSAAAPLTGVVGALPLAYLLGNGAGVPATFILCTLLMLIFAVGYVAMSRHVTNAGAFYAYCARGLGGNFGGAVSIVAMVSYNAMQIGLLGLLGGAAAGQFASVGINLPWWAWSGIAIAIVGFLGYRQVEVSARILMALVLLEYIIVFIVDFAILSKGGAAGLSFNLFEGAAFQSGSLTAAVLFCLGCFIGIEATTIYSEEARDPQKTIPRATYLSVMVIGMFFLFTAWLILAGAGFDKFAATLKGMQDPTAFVPTIAGNFAPAWVVNLMGWLFITSIFAAVSAFHSYIARYTYVAGREGLLSDSLGVTHPVFQSPYKGSIIQTICAIIVVAIFALLGLDPILNLFTWISQLGTLGVIGMMGMTSLAVIAYFRKHSGGNAFSTFLAPLVAALAMAALFVYIFLNFGDLTGTAGGVLAWVLPALIPVAFIVGMILANNLKSRDAKRFAALGTNL
ncbi:MAG: APC family permease [Alphaproteobacteria bacterium]|nr:APC family permease [Alphaproteobacteria bacterium]